MLSHRKFVASGIVHHHGVIALACSGYVYIAGSAVHGDGVRSARGSGYVVTGHPKRSATGRGIVGNGGVITTALPRHINIACVTVHRDGVSNVVARQDGRICCSKDRLVAVPKRDIQ